MRAALPAAFLLAPAAAFAAGADGLWRTQANDAGGYLVVEVGPCGDDPAKTCGTIARAMLPSGEQPDYPHLGREMISGMIPQDPGEWSGGTIWAPDDDKTYNASMSVEDDVLTVEGCVLFICRSQDWTRVE